MRPFFRSSIIAAGLAATLSAAPATAAPTFDNGDLKGEFLFTFVEVRRDFVPSLGTFVVQQCVSAGTAIFDGVGTMTGSGTNRCSVTGTEPISGDKPLYYAVNPDGSVLLSESTDMSDPLHGQIVEHGRSLLLDGTTRTLPAILSQSGIMMKR
jgi:hypothetical protein